MGRINKHQPVKLVIGFIFREEGILDKAKNILRKEFGKIDYESQALAFIHTDYYETELGKNLKRKFISFEKLIRPQNLPQIKITTNIVEKKISRKCRISKVNLQQSRNFLQNRLIVLS